MATPSLSRKPVPKPMTSFSVRPAVKSDAAGIARINEHVVKFSLRGTQDSAAPASSVEKGLSNQLLPNMVYLVATLNSAGRHTTENDSIDLGARGHKEGDALGYIIILPYKEDNDKERPRGCYDRTASLYIFSFEEDVLGEKLYGALNSVLIDEALASCKERGLRFRTVIVSSVFHREQESLISFRDIFIEKGFKEAGLVRQVAEKHGLLLDQITLQRDL